MYAILAALVIVMPPNLPGSDAPAKPAAKVYQVPYRLTNTNHVMVRAKINGKGPYNFILDTGAPALFVSPVICEKLGITANKQGWGKIPSFEIEGRVPLTDARARLETPFQLEGMNGLGLAGAELHGLMGYTVLAKFKMDYDYNKLQMIWTPLKPAPPPPEMRGVFGFEMEEKDNAVHVKKVMPDGGAEKGGLKKGDRIVSINTKKVNTIDEVRDLAGKTMAGKSMVMTVEREKETKDLKMTAGADVGGSGGMEMMVMMVRAMTWLLGVGPQPAPQPRGFFGFEMDDGDKVVTVSRVLAESPAAKAGLMKGDRIVQVQSSGDVESAKVVLDRAKKITPGQVLTLMVERGKERVELKITAGDGL